MEIKIEKDQLLQNSQNPNSLRIIKILKSYMLKGEFLIIYLLIDCVAHGTDFLKSKLQK